jgi:uncharacterized protein
LGGVRWLEAPMKKKLSSRAEHLRAGAKRGTFPTLFAKGGAGLATALAVLLLTSLAAFALTFPALTGRVVDQANIIPAETRAALETKLADLEAKSGIQLVVATVTSLEGGEIEPYANELFRFWKLGEKTRNNGVLLLVAPKEHRVRIEVGYGLEGTLTDALSKVIITNAMTPRFKAGEFGDGIVRGVDDIITVLTTDSTEWQQRPSLRLDSQHARGTGHTSWFPLILMIVAIFLLIVSPRFRMIMFAILMSRGRGGSYSSGGFSGGSGGGFSGGGGSSGGGGASGGW